MARNISNTSSNFFRSNRNRAVGAIGAGLAIYGFLSYAMKSGQLNSTLEKQQTFSQQTLPLVIIGLWLLLISKCLDSRENFNIQPHTQQAETARP